MTAEQVRNALIAFIDAMPIESQGRNDRLRHVENRGRDIIATGTRWYTVELSAIVVLAYSCIVNQIEAVVTIHYASSDDLEKRIAADGTLLMNRAPKLHLENAGIWNATPTILGVTETDGDIALVISVVIQYAGDNALIA